MKPSLWIPAVLAAIAFASPAHAVTWLPVTAEDRAATASKIDPDAGAEILYRMKQYDNGEMGAGETSEYVRIKVFNEKGVRRASKVEIVCTSYETIGWLEGACHQARRLHY